MLGEFLLGKLEISDVLGKNNLHPSSILMLIQFL
jgi:hypothetical protein